MQVVRKGVCRLKKEEGRSYPIEGLGKFWSVTTILGILEKPALVQWSANCAAEYVREKLLTLPAIWSEDIICICDEAKTAHKTIKDDAADIGTQVHDWIEKWAGTMRGQQPNYTAPCEKLVPDISVRNGIAAFMEWAKEVNLLPLESEVRVYHPQYRYAGRFDLIATLKQGKQRKPRTYLIDIKTSSAIYDSMLYQLAGYEEAYRVCDGKHKIDGRGIIRLDKKTGKPEWKEYNDSEEIYGWNIFFRLAEIYYLIKGTPNGG